MEQDEIDGLCVGDLLVFDTDSNPFREFISVWSDDPEPYCTSVRQYTCRHRDTHDAVLVFLGACPPTVTSGDVTYIRVMMPDGRIGRVSHTNVERFNDGEG